MDKQKLVCSYNGILFCTKKELSTDTCYSIDELGKHYAQGEKPGTKGHVYEMSKVGKSSQRQKADSRVPGAGGGRGGVSAHRSRTSSFW